MTFIYIKDNGIYSTKYIFCSILIHPYIMQNNVFISQKYKQIQT